VRPIGLYVVVIFLHIVDLCPVFQRNIISALAVLQLNENIVLFISLLMKNKHCAICSSAFIASVLTSFFMFFMIMKQTTSLPLAVVCCR